MGTMWAKPVWGIWWTWDARLTSSFLLLFLYAAYLVIRPAAPVERRATVCAVVCILGMADVPLVYLSNRLFRTQHPSPVIGGGRRLRPGAGDADHAVLRHVRHVAAVVVRFCGVRRRVARLERAADRPHPAGPRTGRFEAVLTQWKI